jgi:hypothetical protein
MAAPALLTVADMVEYLVDYQGGTVREESTRDCKRAIAQAIREFPNEHKWSYYYQLGRIVTRAPYSTGTFAYDHTGGTYERLVTLTGGTFPAWAAEGVFRIGSVDYEVAERKSDTEITLEIGQNPGADVAALTTYTLFCDTYSLPTDFAAISELRAENWLTMDWVHPREWLALKRVLTSAATPRNYTITGDPNFQGGMALRFYPHPDAATTVDFIYYRRPRRLFVHEYSVGTVSVTADSATITGVNTVWNSDMAGAVIRLSPDNKNLPTSFIGGNQYAFERLVAGFSNSTSISADYAFESSLSGVKYVISDPIDVEDGAMFAAFQRLCEKNITVLRKMKDKPLATKEYEIALLHAKNADSRNFAQRVAGGEPRYGRLPLHNYPLGSNIG